jgi:Putative metal-binding motif
MRSIPRPLALSAALALLPACGARTGLEYGEPPPPGPECLVDADCDTGDLCNPAKCVLFATTVDGGTPDGGTQGGTQAGGTCQALPAVDCNDNDPCTKDACNPDNGNCTYTYATLDLDGDGYHGPLPGTVAGQPGSCGNDCDDTNPKAHPGAIEVCDGVDNDCNGIVDDNAHYVPLNADVQISSPQLAPAGPGGLSWSGNVYASLYTGDTTKTGGGDRVFISMLQPTGTTVKPPGEQPFTFVNADAYAGPVVWVGDRFGVIWQDRRLNNNYQAFFSLLGEDGAKKLPDTQVSFVDDGIVGAVNPNLAWNGTEFLVAWQLAPNGIYDLFAQRLSVDGALIGGVQQLTQTDMGLGNESPTLAPGKNGVGVSWFLGDALNKMVSFQIFSVDLTAPVIPPISLTDGSTKAEYPTVIWNQDRYIVAWFDDSAQPRAIYAAAIGPDGTLLVKPRPVSSPAPFRSRWPYLRALGDRVLVIYSDDRDGNQGYEIYSHMISNNLESLGQETRITQATGDSLHPVASFGPDGNVGVLFRDDRFGQQDVWFTRLGCVAGTTPPP